MIIFIVVIVVAVLFLAPEDSVPLIKYRAF